MASVARTASRFRPIIARAAFRPTTSSKAFISTAARQNAAGAAAAMVTENGEQPFFPDEPRGPMIRTQIPGPESVKAIEKLSKVFDTRSLNMMANYNDSYGN